MRTFYAKNRKDWRRWLEKNHDSRDEIWLILYKKDSGIHGVNREDALEEALCFGWIDSVQKKHDENSSVQRFSPRRPNSNWSPANRLLVKRLIAHGQMTEAGLITLPEELKSPA
jgi:uncharacterized protein YdeI (YjbR/CyaY-like superfamily)